MSAPVERILAALTTRDLAPRELAHQFRWVARCPAHDDRMPSLQITEGDEGALLKCYAGCELDAILGELGLQRSDLFPASDQPAKRLVASYDYVDEDGVLLYQVCRFDPKTFRQRRPAPGGTWEWSLGRTRRVLYKLPQLIAAVARGDTIIIVEGEKDVHTLEQRGKTATTCVGGAGKWREGYNDVFRGANVAIVADDDEPGYKHALAVAAALDQIAAKVKILRPAIGKDITDHIRAGFPLSALRPFDEQPPDQPAPETTGIWVGTARELAEIPPPDRSNELLGPLVFRGHRLMIAAATGEGKTTLSLQMIAAMTYGREFLEWHGKGGLRAMVIDVEQGRGTIQRRIREAGLATSDDVLYLIAPDGLALDTDERHVNQLERLFAEHDPHVVLADPFYKLHRGDANDARAAVDLMRRFDAWRDRFGFALILPMHTRKPVTGTKFTMAEIFGSGTYQWGAEIVLGLQRSEGGHANLYFWKDREGDLETLGDRWDLMWERDRGFRRVHPSKGVAAAIEHVRSVLTGKPNLTLDELHTATTLSRPVLRARLGDLNAQVANPSEKRVGHQCWYLPNALPFDPDTGATIDYTM